MVDIGYARPAPAVVRHADDELPAWGATADPGVHSGHHCEVRVDRVAGGLAQRRLLVGHRLPGAVEVVPLKGGEVQVVEDLAYLEAVVDDPLVGRQERPMRFSVGHSQSMSNPSNTPAATPGPPLPPSRIGRFPLMNRSMQEATNAWRDCSVSAASEKNLDQVKPPSDMSTLRSGYLALSLRSCRKLPASG